VAYILHARTRYAVSLKCTHGRCRDARLRDSLDYVLDTRKLAKKKVRDKTVLAQFKIKTNELNAYFLNFLNKVVQDYNEADAVAGLLAMQVGAPKMGKVKSVEPVVRLAKSVNGHANSTRGNGAGVS
jgi:hypothetical protein